MIQYFNLILLFFYIKLNRINYLLIIYDTQSNITMKQNMYELHKLLFNNLGYLKIIISEDALIKFGYKLIVEYS
jgi:predicted site-specific integrase-resolvase